MQGLPLWMQKWSWPLWLSLPAPGNQVPRNPSGTNLRPNIISAVLEGPGRQQCSVSVLRSRQCHWGEEAYYTWNKQNPAPDSSHCNFRVNQVTLCSRGQHWQRPSRIHCSHCWARLWAPLAYLERSCFYNVFQNQSAQCESGASES